MVNDFSDYAKPTRLQLEPVNVDALLNEVLALYEGGTQMLALQLDAAELEIEADPVRLRQVMHNLIKNALEASGEHGCVIVSSRSAKENNGFVEIAVSDNGPGFDPDLIGQVFEPYVTNKTKGTGLSLAIVKRIIAEHGGLVQRRTPTRGGRVVLRLPVMARAPRSAAPAAGRAQGGGGR